MNYKKVFYGQFSDHLCIQWDSKDPELDAVLNLLGDQGECPAPDQLLLWIQAWPQYNVEIEEFCTIWESVVRQYKAGPSPWRTGKIIIDEPVNIWNHSERQ
ncbi:MAG: hypothetical protein KJN72_12225 [Woeseia sp.]|nr:hypothetical protein [Woeseia sp.]